MGGSDKAKTALILKNSSHSGQSQLKKVPGLCFYVLALREMKKEQVPRGYAQQRLYLYVQSA
jgi:hypothetical protein